MTDEKYTFTKLIRESGKPSQVLLLTNTHGMDFPLPFSLLLSYKEKNFVALFTTLHEENYENIVACFDEGAYLQIFNTGDQITDKYLIDRLSGNESSEILEIEESLGMNLQEFYEYYRDDNTNCVTTPASVWP